MVSDERRSHKLYALPIRYVPYQSLRDQYIRNLNKDVTRVMQERGLNLVGKHDMHGIQAWNSIHFCVKNQVLFDWDEFDKMK